jgi:HSP20 family protein
MALIRWEPVPMNRLITSLFDTPTGFAPPVRRFVPATDIVETDTHYVLRADLPGVAEEDLSIELDRDVLTISGQRRGRSEQRSGGYVRYERSTGSFRRSVRLPEGVDADAIEATFERGVLEISIPKPERIMPRSITINTGSGARAIDAAEAPSAEADAVAEQAPAAEGDVNAQENAAATEATAA